MEHYTGLHKYISEFLNTMDESELVLGRFNLKCNAGILIKIKLKRIESDSDSESDSESESLTECLLIAADMEDIDTMDPYYTLSFTSASIVMKELVKEVDIQYSKLLDILHEKIICCRHCGEIFGLNDTDYEMYGFSDQSLCNDCGLQNIYDVKFSEDKCCICLDAIGFGEFLAVCGDIRHKLHIGCGRSQHICPLCKRGREIEIIDDTDPED
jgi:hypothetical protein